MGSIIWWLWEHLSVSLISQTDHSQITCCYEPHIHAFSSPGYVGYSRCLSPGRFAAPPNACRSQMRFAIPSTSSGPIPRSLPSLTCLETIQKMALGKHPNLASFDEQATLWRKVTLAGHIDNLILWVATVGGGWNVDRLRFIWSKALPSISAPWPATKEDPPIRLSKWKVFGFVSRKWAFSYKRTRWLRTRALLTQTPAVTPTERVVSPLKNASCALELLSLLDSFLTVYAVLLPGS